MIILYFDWILTLLAGIMMKQDLRFPKESDQRTGCNCKDDCDQNACFKIPCIGHGPKKYRDQAKSQ